MKQLMTLGLLAMLALGAAGIGFVAGQGSTEEVRVVARSANDGRIEFGIEHDGERILPTGRYMSAAQIGARNDRWLRSTPVTIKVGGEELSTTPTSAPSTEWTGMPIERAATQEGSTVYSAVRDRFTGSVNTVVLVEGVRGSSLWQGVFGLGCHEGNLGFAVSDTPYISSLRDDFTTVQFVIDSGSPISQRMRIGSGGDSLAGQWDWSSSLGTAIRNGRTLYVRFDAYSEQWNGEFDISDLFNTPVQPNLDNCGG